MSRVSDRLLRRADWRFLLPDPSPDVVACFGVGALRRSVLGIFGSVHGPETAPTGGCDLVVASGGDPENLRRAIRVLRPGGVLYSEWGHLRNRSRVVRNLERAGFQGIRCYWIFPPPTLRTPKFWISLDDPVPIRFFRGPSAPVWPPIIRTGGRLLLAAWALALRLRLFRPVCAVASKRGATTPGTSTTPTAGFPRFLAPNGHAGGESWSLLTLGPRSSSKVVGLIFGRGDPRPRVVVKIPRVPEAARGIVREEEVLRDLEAWGLAPPGVPRVLFSDHFGGLRVLGETPLDGVPLWRRIDREDPVDLASRATEWVAGLVRGPAAAGRVPLAASTDAFENLAGNAAAIPLATTRRVLGELDGLPVVTEHRDLGPWNMLIDGRTIRVMDWESAVAKGFPLLDLIYFLTHLAFFGSRAIRSRGLERLAAVHRATLEPQTRWGALRARFTSEYAARIGIDPRHLPALGVATWMVHAPGELARLRSDLPLATDVELLHRSLFFRLWRQEIDHAFGRRGRHA